MPPRIRSAKIAKVVMLEVSRMLGRQGGHQRAKNLTKKERSEGARRAAKARWSKRKKKPAK
jgi:hypothetical protein